VDSYFGLRALRFALCCRGDNFLLKRRIAVINSYCVMRIAYILLCERILIRSLG